MSLHRQRLSLCRLCPRVGAITALACSFACATPTHVLHREPALGRPLWLSDGAKDPACTTLAQAVVSADVQVDIEQARGDALRGARALVAQKLEGSSKELQERVQGHEEDYFHEGAAGENNRMAPVRVHVRFSACAEKGYPEALHDGTEIELLKPPQHRNAK